MDVFEYVGRQYELQKDELHKRQNRMDGIEYLVKADERLDSEGVKVVLAIESKKLRPIELVAGAEISNGRIKAVLPVMTGPDITGTEIAVLEHCENAIGKDNQRGLHGSFVEIETGRDAERFLSALREDSEPLRKAGVSLRWVVGYPTNGVGIIVPVETQAPETEAIPVQPYRDPAKSMREVYMDHVREHGSISFDEACSLFPDSSRDSVSTTLYIMRRRHVLENREGKKLIKGKSFDEYTPRRHKEAVQHKAHEEKPPIQRTYGKGIDTLDANIVLYIGDNTTATKRLLKKALGDFAESSIDVRTGRLARAGIIETVGKNLRLSEIGKPKYNELCERHKSLKPPSYEKLGDKKPELFLERSVEKFKAHDAPKPPEKSARPVSHPEALNPEYALKLAPRMEKLLRGRGLLTPEGASSLLGYERTIATGVLEHLVLTGLAIKEGPAYKPAPDKPRQAIRSVADPLSSVRQLEVEHEEKPASATKYELRTSDATYLELAACAGELTPAYVSGQRRGIPLMDAAERIEFLKHQGLLSGDKPEQGSLSEAGMVALYGSDLPTSQKRKTTLRYLSGIPHAAVGSMSSYGVMPEMLKQYEAEGTVEIKGDKSNTRLQRVSITEKGRKILGMIK